MSIRQPGVWMVSGSSSQTSTICSASAMTKVGSRGENGVEVPCRPAEDKVAHFIGLPGVDQGDVAAQRLFQQVFLPVHLDDRLSLGDRGTEPRRRQNAADAGAARADALA